MQKFTPHNLYQVGENTRPHHHGLGLKFDSQTW